MSERPAQRATPAAYARLPEHVLVENVGGDTVFLDLQRSRYCSLNGVGSRMFELALELPTLDDVVDALVREYDAEPAVIRQDLDQLVSRLRSEGLLLVND